MTKTKYKLVETLDEHVDMIDGLMYAYASQEMLIRSNKIDEYYLLYINSKPKYCPKWLYELIIRKFVSITIIRG